MHEIPPPFPLLPARLLRLPHRRRPRLLLLLRRLPALRARRPRRRLARPRRVLVPRAGTFGALSKDTQRSRTLRHPRILGTPSRWPMPIPPTLRACTSSTRMYAARRLKPSPVAKRASSRRTCSGPAVPPLCLRASATHAVPPLQSNVFQTQGHPPAQSHGRTITLRPAQGQPYFYHSLLCPRPLITFPTLQMSVDAAQEYNSGAGWEREHLWPQSLAKYHATSRRWRRGGKRIRDRRVG